MVYMAGDNNLSSAGDADLVEMRRVGSSERVNVVVEFDNAGNRGARRIHIRKDGKGETVDSLDETNSGSPDVLLNFISWAAKKYPAERYALILWNHGGGWAPSEVDQIAQSLKSPGWDIKERSSSSLSQVFFRSSLQEIVGLSGPAERAICSDDGSGHSLDTVELGQVIADGTRVIGQRFDLLGMDACLMSNLEVAFQLRDHVRYVVASEETEPGTGWPYDRILERLTSEPTIETADFAGSIVSDYIDWHKEEPAGDDTSVNREAYVSSPDWSETSGKPGVNVTQTAMDLSQLPGMTGLLDEFAGYLKAEMADTYADIWNAQKKTTKFANDTLWDLGHFCREFEKISQTAPAVEAARAVREALEPGQGRFLVAESHRGEKVEQCTGVTIYFPPIIEISRYYHDLDFASKNGWTGMLEAYHDELA